MKNISALLSLLLVAATAAQAAGQAAQGGPRDSGFHGPPMGGYNDIPGVLPALPPRGALLEPLDERREGPLDESPADGAEEISPMPETLPPGQVDSPLGGSILGEPMKFLEACHPYFESSGSWLERGFWYAEMDYLLLNRGWDRKGLRLAFEVEQGFVPDGVNASAPVIGLNELRIRGERPGAEGTGRLTLGRFLFRDTSNRDHSVEASWTGGGEWSQSGNLRASTAAGLEISDFIDRTNPSFTGARSMDFSYDSEMNTVEANYLVKQRMHRDQMVMQPSGAWVRKATPTRTYSYLAGLRYVNHREFLDYNAQDIPVRTTPTPVLREDGFYDVQTESNMFGAQFGGSLARETARWSLSASVKGGPMVNRIDLNSRFRVGESVVTNSGQTNSTEDDLAFFGEAQLMGKWHLRPNVSLRAGLELLFIDSIALAPHQVNFVPGGFEQIASSGDSVYLGTSFGLESYW